jgi:hypothetical protein
MIGQGTYYGASEKNAIIVQWGSRDSARMYVMLRSKSETFLATSGLAEAAKSPEALKARLINDEEFFCG